MSSSGWSGFIKTLGSQLSGPIQGPREKLVGEDGNYSAIYPDDLFAHGHQAFIFFNIRSLEHIENPSSGSICLYMPSTLSVGYGANWSDTTFPLKKLKETFKSLAGLGINSYSIATGEGDITDKVQNVVDQVINNNALQAGVHNAIRKELSADYAAEFRDAVKKTFNPFKAVVYDVPEFRHFNFGFEFFAKNADEADEVRKIIKMFKLAMHPARVGDTDNLLWSFPYVFDIFLCTPYTDKMFLIKQAALTSADVDYAGSTVQAFFKDGNPVHIKLDLKFKEMSLLTREDIEDNY